MDDVEITALAPLFVGGTGRSGTTLVARLLGAASEYHTIPIEVRFLVDPHGLCDVIGGKTEMDRFARLITGQWWHRVPPDGNPRGLHRIMSEPALRDALDCLAASLEDDPVEAGRRFVHELLDPLAQSAGAAQWIEMTPPNVARGNELATLVPSMKLVHSVRDGRDVACSVALKDWGPPDIYGALDWWANCLFEANTACDELGSDQLYVLEMEDLVERDRRRSLDALLGFVGIEATPALLDYFERDVQLSRSHSGRWKEEVSSDDREAFDGRYRSHLEDLRRAGAPAPSLIDGQPPSSG